ncbi:MAG: hypothetical protein RLZZ379_804 [Pseudomonadota bacterium]
MTFSYTVKSSLLGATARLNSKEASYEAQLLLQAVLGVNRAWIISHANDALETLSNIAFEALINRRLNGEPVAYILGHREFYGLDLLVTPDTLIPRPDTETLVEAALAKIPQSAASQKNTSITPSFRRKSESSGVEQYSQKTLDSDFCRNDEMSVLDLGTGTGAIALAIAKNRPEVLLTAVDASIGALEVAKKNAQNLAISNVQFLLSHWFDGLADENNGCAKFDIIVSNPPYIEQNDIHLSQGDLRFEPISALASGKDGLDDIRQIIDDCLIHLKPQGWLMLEHGYNQAESVADLMAETGLTCIATIKDLGGNDRVTIAKNPLIVSTHWD